MRVINRKVKHTQAAELADLTNFMRTRRDASFDDIRLAVSGLANEPDHIVHQAVIDAGFEVVED